MPTKLKFKGDKTKKRRRHAVEENETAGSSSRKRRREGNDEDDETWVRPDNALEIRGPTFIYHPSDPHPVCISFDATRGRVNVTTLDKDKEKGEEDEEQKDSSKSDNYLDRVPTDVSQVWVATRVAGSDTITLRTG